MAVVQGILLSIVISYFIYKITKILFKHWKLIQFCKTLPGPNAVLQIPAVKNEDTLFSRGYLKQFPRLHTMWRASFLPFVSVHHPDTIKPILQHVGLKKNGYLTAYHRLSLLFNSLTASDIEGVTERRQIMDVYLNAEKRLQYQSEMKEAIDLMMCDISINSNKSDSSVDMYPLINKVMLDIHLRNFFSYDRKKALFQWNKYIQLEGEWMNIFYYRHMHWYLYPDFIFYLTRHGLRDILIRKEMRAIVQVLLDHKEKIHSRKRSSMCKDLIDLIINKQNRNSLCDSALEMLVGRRGVVSAVSWTLYYLVTYKKKYQQVVRDETKSLFDDNNNIRTDLQEQDFKRLKHTNMFLKEVLRICPPIPSTERQISKDIEIDGFTFPAGTCFYLNIYGLHHNEDLWDKPDEFIPERFEEDLKSDQRMKYSPFLAYSRRCVAKNFSMECITIIIARLLQRYTLSLDESTVVSKDVRFHQMPDNGLRLVMKPIDDMN